MMAWPSSAPLLLSFLAQAAGSPSCAAPTSWANGTTYAAPSLRIVATTSVASCCNECGKTAGCAYFSYSNTSCALKATFGEPKLAAGVTSGSVNPGAPPRDYAHHDDVSLLAALRRLPRLPKPHWSWPINPTSTIPEYTRDPYVLEVARLMGSISFSAEFVRAEHVTDIVRACLAANVTQVGVHYWGMWRRFFPPKAPPTYTGPEEQAELARFESDLRNVSTWLAAANAALGGNVTVGIVMIDSEHFRTRPAGGGAAWNAAITAKHTKTFELAKRVLRARDDDVLVALPARAVEDRRFRHVRTVGRRR